MAQDIILERHTARLGPTMTHLLPRVVRTLAKVLFDPYRPERHYMRGPGPKWRAKHAYAGPAAQPTA